MKKILSFGGGLQTTALAIMIARGELAVDEVVFADTGAEKPETYWYIENYIKPIITVPFVTVRSHLGSIYDYCWQKKSLPSVIHRWCTDKFKVRPIEKCYPDTTMLIGFSLDEAHRARKPSRLHREFPLIKMGLTVNDCVGIIKDYGFPVPLRSSCFFCVYEPYIEWNWLKNNHPELMEKALALEERHYERYPHLRNTYGLLRGTPLWKIKNGLQPEMLIPGENSCWSGHCGH